MIHQLLFQNIIKIYTISTRIPKRNHNPLLNILESPKTFCCIRYSQWSFTERTIFARKSRGVGSRPAAPERTTHFTLHVANSIGNRCYTYFQALCVTNAEVLPLDSICFPFVLQNDCDLLSLDLNVYIAYVSAIIVGFAIKQIYYSVIYIK